MNQQWAPPVGDVAAPTAASPSSIDLVDRVSTSQAARAIVLAVAAGLVAQLLFVGQAGGVNVMLWVGLVLAAALVVRSPQARIDPTDRWLPVAALVSAALVALRDDAMLFMFNLPTSGALTLAAVVAMGGYPLTRRSAAWVARAAAAALAVAAIGGGYLAGGMRHLTGWLGTSRSPLASPIVRGIVFALPLLAVFVTLFAAADGIVEAQLRAIATFELDVPELLGRGLFALVAGWAFAGTMVAAWLLVPRPAPDEAAPAAWRLGRVEALVVLGLLDALFVAFVAIQGAYLFGGLDTLAASGLTYAEYARRGFFELVTVALLVGLVILAVGRRVAGPDRVVRGAAVVLALLTGAVLLSATYRMGLYQAAYGWTELRFYVLAAIVWLAICLVAAAVALVRDDFRWLVHAALAAGLLVALGTNLVGPQAFAAQRNLERAIDPSLVPADGRAGIDLGYIGELGADAVPVLLAARDRLAPPQAAAVHDLLTGYAYRLRESQAGWPSWNYSRHRALEALTQAGY